MRELAQILKTHAARYPLMRPTDAVKLVYQNEFGGGHLIRDSEECLRYLRQEYGAVEKNPGIPLCEDIGNGIVRVNLAALDDASYPLEQLGQDFIRSASLHKGNMEQFLEKLRVLRQLTQEGIFSFPLKELDAYLTEYGEAGYPPVSHSPEYRTAYTPAYRILLKALLP